MKLGRNLILGPLKKHDFYVFFVILGPWHYQNRTQHVLKPPGKISQGLGDHLGSIYNQKSIFVTFL